MWQFDGLPLHPLVVHAPVVLVPLVAAGLALFVVWPSARRVLGPVVAIFAIGAAVMSIVGVSTGEQLADALQRGDSVARHAERGESVRNLSVLVAAATALAVGLDRSSSPAVRRWSPPAASVVTIGAIATVLMVGLTGHSGAQLAWEGKVPSADTPPSVPSSSTPAPSPTTIPAATATEPLPVATTAISVEGEVVQEEVVEVVLGEWALITSVTEAPPGPVAFRIRNAGQHVHSFRIRTPGSGKNRLEWRSPEVAPGGEILWTVDLAARPYEFTCPVEDSSGEHDELGMQSSFTVRDGAAPPLSPPVTEPSATPAAPTTPAGPSAAPAAPAPAAGPVTVDIRAFAFTEAELHIPVGADVVWSNSDPAPHTATGESFDTGTLAAGATATVRFDAPGVNPYFCVLHPSMTATVVVDG